jgi:flagellar hook-associated protein 3 FlgL
MVTTSVGDMARSFAFRSKNLDLKTDLQRLSTEMTTGQTTDIARKFSGDISLVSGLDTSLAKIAGYRAQTQEAGLFATTMQTSLQTIDSFALSLRQSLLTVSAGSGAAQIVGLGGEAQQTLKSTIAALNTAVSGRSLFAGVETASVPVGPPEGILTALDAATAGAISVQEVVAAVSNWFDDPAGFAAQAYRGGAPLEPVTVAPGETARLDITATDPAIRDTLKGIALAALLGRGLFTGQPDLQKSLAEAAATNLMQSQTPRLDLSARLGVVEAQISRAETRNSSEETALQIARNDLTSVDPYTAATQLQATQTQLETIYALTARMSHLSLLDYL